MRHRAPVRFQVTGHAAAPPGLRGRDGNRACAHPAARGHRNRGVRSVLALALVALALSAGPAAAISADVAKKCRAFAVKAHPPQPAGTKGYAQAERDAFRDCVAKEEKQNK